MRRIIISSKPWVDGDEYYRMSRVVLIKNIKDNGELHDYSTHIQCPNEELENQGRLELYWGHYFQQLEDALKDYQKREAD